MALGHLTFLVSLTFWVCPVEEMDVRNEYPQFWTLCLISQTRTVLFFCIAVVNSINSIFMQIQIVSKVLSHMLPHLIHEILCMRKGENVLHLFTKVKAQRSNIQIGMSKTVQGVCTVITQESCGSRRKLTWREWSRIYKDLLLSL